MNIVIIGAGLAGLTTAYVLKKEGVKASVLEARNRIGGRIHTIVHEGISMEMGATWLNKNHHHLSGLLEELGIGTFKQYLSDFAIYELDASSLPQLVSLPPNSDPSFRIIGGSSNLINTLASHLEESQIKTGHQVQSVEQKDECFLVQTEKEVIDADIIVSTLPPKLLVDSIIFSPALPSEMIQLSQNTHTWMGESIKVGIWYKEAFWKGQQTSGTIFSNAGPIVEMYDHSNMDQKGFALKGFIHDSFYSFSKEDRKKLVLRQLEKFFGAEARQVLAYEEYLWRKDPLTFFPYDQFVAPHQNNGNPAFRKTIFDGRLILAGAETAAGFPGYMDGAVQSGQQAAKQVLKKIMALK